MKADLYTKAVLTIIAICLVVVTLRGIDILPEAYAGVPYSDNIKTFGLVPLNEDGSIDVNIKDISQVMNVNVAYISPDASVKVTLDRVNCTVPVEMK